MVLFFVRAVRKDLQREDERFGKKSRDQMTLWIIHLQIRRSLFFSKRVTSVRLKPSRCGRLQALR